MRASGRRIREWVRPRSWAADGGASWQGQMGKTFPVSGGRGQAKFLGALLVRSCRVRPGSVGGDARVVPGEYPVQSDVVAFVGEGIFQTSR